jgi:hypothetical protein
MAGRVGGSGANTAKVCEMQNADTVLSIIRERGRRGLPLERIYRLLFNRDLYLHAYARLYANDGAMTPGTTAETVDGMSIAKIDQLIDDLRYERYRWTPVRRTYIAKKQSTKKRPLGIPTWSNKLLQEVIRLILEAYFEPQFSNHSHGFRPHRGCHTALQYIQTTWTGTRWFVEGDIASYFDTINHDTLLTILSEQLHDNRFLRLIRELLQAGYLEDWKYHQTYSGTPQGGVVSPILANIYWIGSTSTSNRRSSQHTPEETSASPIQPTSHSQARCGDDDARDDERKPTPHASNSNSFRRKTPPIPPIDGSGTSGTQTTSCLASSGHSTRPRTSSVLSGNGCIPTSTSNSPNIKPWSHTRPVKQHGFSDTKSSTNNPT